ncbi:MAG: CHAP domain-containing protein [Armatimonadetes bacterium]|nr:CHAP domain-containing protein [Armatimonadota bacterium]
MPGIGGFPGGGFGGGGFPGVGGGGGARWGQPGGYASGVGDNTGGPQIPTGPVQPGVDGLMQRANSMVGMHEGRDRAAIQQVTGRSGINPATTPWCAAWAMNLLEQHGVMKLDGLSNRNYCPTIKSWSQGKNTWAENGRYTPKAGDAILFDWQGDGTPDHIGIVERVANGRVYTIEGNSSDSVKKNSYAVGDRRVDGYVRS